MSKKGQKEILTIKAYNKETNVGLISHLDENKTQISHQYYKIQDGEEVVIDTNEGFGEILIFLPEDLDHSKKALIINPRTNEIISHAQGVETIPIDKENSLAIPGADAQRKVKNLSDGDQLLLFDCVSQEKGMVKTLDGKFTVPISEEDLEKLFPTNVPATLYNIVIDPVTEFGVGRFMADQVLHLSSLLEKAEVKFYGEINYGIFGTKQIKDHRLDFSYRFTATNGQDAVKISERIKKQLNGIMRKIWLAAWSIGDELKKHTFSVSLLKLMKTCYPDRNTNFSEKEIQEFYQTLKSMKPAEFILVKKYQEKKKEREAKFIISFLQVRFETGEQNKTPSEVLISLYDVTPLPTKREKNRYIGAAIKRDTLNLHAKDTSLALYLQTRINQLKGGGKKKKDINSYGFQRSVLIQEANLQKTNASNPRMANKQLIEKLARCKDEGILKKIPEKIEEVNELEW